MKYIKTLLLISIVFLLADNAFSQELFQKTSKFEVGIENTRLLYGKYIYKDHLTAKLNVSVYSEKLGYQYIRGTIGYQTKIKNFNLSGEYFFGSAFNGNYFNTAVQLKADAVFVKRLLIDARILPWYDSGFGYTTCFEARLGCKITDKIDVKVGYTTVPEYRMSEKRIIGGFDFKVSHLYVSPYISFGRNADTGGNNIRVLFGFGYQF